MSRKLKSLLANSDGKTQDIINELNDVLSADINSAMIEANRKVVELTRRVREAEDAIFALQNDASKKRKK